MKYLGEIMAKYLPILPILPIFPLTNFRLLVIFYKEYEKVQKRNL